MTNCQRFFEKFSTREAAKRQGQKKVGYIILFSFGIQGDRMNF
jgi:hypothetical protein